VAPKAEADVIIFPPQGLRSYRFESKVPLSMYIDKQL
jgi:hypothetical protein